MVIFKKKVNVNSLAKVISNNPESFEKDVKKVLSKISSEVRKFNRLGKKILTETDDAVRQKVFSNDKFLVYPKGKYHSAH